MKFRIFGIFGLICAIQAIDITYTVPSTIKIKSLMSISNVKKFIPKDETIQNIVKKPNKLLISTMHKLYGYTFHNKYQISFDMVRNQLEIYMSNKYIQNNILFFRKNPEMLQINVYSFTKLPVPSIIYNQIVDRKMKIILEQL